MFRFWNCVHKFRGKNRYFLLADSRSCGHIIFHKDLKNVWHSDVSALKLYTNFEQWQSFSFLAERLVSLPPMRFDPNTVSLKLYWFAMLWRVTQLIFTFLSWRIATYIRDRVRIYRTKQRSYSKHNVRYIYIYHSSDIMMTFCDTGDVGSRKPETREK